MPHPGIPKFHFSGSKLPLCHIRGPVRVNMTLKQQDKIMKGNDANETKGDVR